ncbi:2OG-Fe(II) oxygenase, partial [Paenibacillus dendritiformis]
MLDRLAQRMAQLDWSSVRLSLDEHGYAKLPAVLDAAACEHLIGTYTEEANFRKTISMARYRFGIGEYKYYDAPLPPLLQQLREGLYPELAGLANVWRQRLGSGGSPYPERPALISGALPRSRPDPPHPASPGIRNGGLQIPPPRYVRRG